MGLLLATVLLAAMGWLGIALARRLAPALDGLERIAYGVPLGAVVASLAILAAASVAGRLLPAIVAVAIVLAAATGAVLRPWNESPDLRLPSPASLILLLAVSVRWGVLYWNIYSVDASGLWAGHLHVWGDWSAHLGDVSSFAYGDNFPPHHPRLAGYRFAYHYLTSITAAAMVVLGLPVTVALALHSFVFSLAAMLAVFAFVRGLTGRDGVAGLAVGLFLFGGGLGWWLPMQEGLSGPGGWHQFWQRPWDPALQADHNFRWQNVYFSLLLPQRGYLYGLPLTLLVLTLLRRGIEGRGRREFIVAGLIAGLLPLAHLGSMFALGVLTVALAALFPTIGWAWFVGCWAALAIPQLLLQQGPGPGALGAMRWQPGWVAGPDGWVWFWAKNAGLFWPLVMIGLGQRGLCPAAVRRFLLAFMALFVLANLLVFQPWDWDNTKVLVYWFLATCVLAALVIAQAWSAARLAGRVGLVALVVVLVGSGTLENLDQLLGRDRHLLLTAEEIRVGEYVRTVTPARSVLAAGPQHNQPASLLAGRTVVLGYPGWIWSHGLPYADRERDLRTIFQGGHTTDSLVRRYHAGYILIGPARSAWPANADALRRRYPSVLRTEHYELFQVTSSAEATDGPRTRPE